VARLPSAIISAAMANEALNFIDFDSENRKKNLMFKIADPEWSL